jgi:hypothetical protein
LPGSGVYLVAKEEYDFIEGIVFACACGFYERKDVSLLAVTCRITIVWHPEQIKLPLQIEII